jgi:hypothetical protein
MFRIVTGSVLLLIGLGFIFLSFTISAVLFIHGGVVSAVGIAILLNKREDDIEEINDNEK